MGVWYYGITVMSTKPPQKPQMLLNFFSTIYVPVKNLLDDSSEEVLILDDSTYDRSRSKKVELLAWVFDHTTKKYLAIS